MLGQAAIKGVVFFVYEWAKAYCAATALGDSSLALILSACLSGAVGSLVVTPVERIKCIMQATEAGTYAGPVACTQQVLRTDGVQGLLFRGLGATLLREVPAYGFYFVSYDVAKDFLLDGSLVSPSLVPLLGGAVAGAMAWIPVYPVDVIKTNIQVQDGAGGDAGFVGTARLLWDSCHGILGRHQPKAARAVVNHAVTFYSSILCVRCLCDMSFVACQLWGTVVSTCSVPFESATRRDIQPTGLLTKQLYFILYWYILSSVGGLYCPPVLH